MLIASKYSGSICDIEPAEKFIKKHYIDLKDKLNMIDSGLIQSNIF